MTLYEVWGVLRRIFKNMKEFLLKTLMTSEKKKKKMRSQEK